MPIPDADCIDGSVTANEDIVFAAWSPDGVRHNSIESAIDLRGDGSSDHAVIDFSFKSIFPLSVGGTTGCLRVVQYGCAEDSPAWGLKAGEERILRIFILRIVILQLVKGCLDTSLLGFSHLGFVDDLWVQQKRAGVFL